jgi:hypothetical protein
MAGVGSPLTKTASTIACRLIPWEIARRTRTSLNGGLSVRM